MLRIKIQPGQNLGGGDLYEDTYMCKTSVFIEVTGFPLRDIQHLAPNIR